MNRYTCWVIMGTMALGWSGPALGSPEPQFLVVQDSQGFLISIHGEKFGILEDSGPLDTGVDPVSERKCCVLLGEYPDFGSCEAVTELTIQSWKETEVTVRIKNPGSEDPKRMYIYLVDQEGIPSLPIGPVDLEKGIDGTTSDLKKESVAFGDKGMVEVLRLTPPDPTTVPGIPGKPEVQ